MGHTLTLMLFGGAVLLLGLVVPLKAAEVLELAVGVMLVLLGASVVYRSWRDGFHWHGHARAPAGGAGSQESALHDRGHRHEFAVRALVVGMVHGMAGSAALILLSLEAADSLAWGVGYIAVFGLGSILGMGFLSVAIAIPLRLTSRYLARAYGALTAAVGLATLALGCMLILEFATGVGAANHR